MAVCVTYVEGGVVRWNELSHDGSRESRRRSPRKCEMDHLVLSAESEMGGRHEEPLSTKYQLSVGSVIDIFRSAPRADRHELTFFAHNSFSFLLRTQDSGYTTHHHLKSITDRSLYRSLSQYLSFGES
jgi:hypothetical protein